MVMEQRVSRLEGAFEELSARLRSMEGHLEAMRAENAQQGARFEKLLKEQGDRFEARFDKLEAETNARFEKMQADMTRQFKEQNDKIDATNRENTQRIDQQNRMILTGMAIILSAGGLALGLGLAFG